MAFIKKKDFSKASREEVIEAAKAYVYRSVSAAEQSSLKLSKKMRLRGYPEYAITETINNAIELGIINDHRYSECLIRNALAFNKGLEFVEKEIEALGIDLLSLDAYQEYLEAGEKSQMDSAMNLLLRSNIKAKDKYAACYRKLRTKGYSSNISSSAAKKYCSLINENEC